MFRFISSVRAKKDGLDEAHAQLQRKCGLASRPVLLPTTLPSSKPLALHCIALHRILYNMDLQTFVVIVAVDRGDW